VHRSARSLGGKKHLLLAGLDTSLGGLGSGLVNLLNTLDDTYGDRLPHVSDSEATKRGEFGIGFNAHRLRRNHLDDGRVTRLDKLRVVLELLAGTTIDLLNKLGELAGNMGGVAIEHWCVASADLTGVVEDDDLSVEGCGFLGGVVLGVRADETTTDFLNRYVLDVEADIVTGDTLGELFVMHFDGLHFSRDTSGGEGDNHTGLDDTSLDTTDGDCANTTDLVHILEGKTEGLVGRTGRGVNGIDGFEEGLATLVAGLGVFRPSLEPGHIDRLLQHVVAVPAGDRDEWNSSGIETNLLDEG